MESNNTDINTRVASLENQVKTLKSENKSLVHRIIYLEELVKKLCEKQNIPVTFNSLPALTNTKKIKLNTNIPLTSSNYGKKNLPPISNNK